ESSRECCCVARLLAERQRGGPPDRCAGTTWRLRCARRAFAERGRPRWIKGDVVRRRYGAAADDVTGLNGPARRTAQLRERGLRRGATRRARVPSHSLSDLDQEGLGERRGRPAELDTLLIGQRRDVRAARGSDQR